MLLDSLKIKTILYPSSLGLPYIITFTDLTKVGGGDAYRDSVVISGTSPQACISLAFCRAEHLPSSCSATLSSSRSFCFLLSLMSFLQVFHQPRTFHIIKSPFLTLLSFANKRWFYTPDFLWAVKGGSGRLGFFHCLSPDFAQENIVRGFASMAEANRACSLLTMSTEAVLT